MSNDDWWDALYGTRRDTNRDTTTRDKTRRDKPRETPRHVGRTVTLKRRPEGPKPLDDLTTETPKKTPRPVDTSKARAARRRNTSKNATSDTTDTPDTTDDTTPRDTETDNTDDTTPDTEDHKRSPGKRVADWLTKAQEGATKLADEVATNTKDAPTETESAAAQERLARALEVITSALQSVEPSRTWMPPWLPAAAGLVFFNVSAAAVGHYPLALGGYPELSPAVLVHDYVEYLAPADTHWTAALVFALIPPLICAITFDRRARNWNSTILRWLVRIPLATTTAGALAATWQIIVQLTTGASS